jgi:ribonuclease T2
MRPFSVAGLCGLLLPILLSGCEQSESQAPQASGAPTPIAQSAPASKPAAAPAPKPSADPAPKRKSARSLPVGTGFDFYVLSLSWSPSYCEAEGEEANGQQCKSGRPYAFVVHGLWPQYERGYPENCDTDDGYVDDGIVRSLRDIMPSGGLIGHQWRKHGSCSGLSQDDYFAVLRAARERVVVPQQFRKLDNYLTVPPGDVEKAFLQSNPGLAAKGSAVTCDDRYLREVRLCMTKDLEFRTCPEVDRRACTLPKAVMPPVRGG